MPQNFVQDFKDALTQIQADANEVGLNLTSICRDTGISRSTPDRWLRKPPKTVLLIAEMQKKITDRRAAIAADDFVLAKTCPVAAFDAMIDAQDRAAAKRGKKAPGAPVAK
jgi:hypothetical protein